MAWHGRTILETLCGGAKLTRELAEATGAPDLRGCLRHLRARGFMTSAEGVHSITDAGREALENSRKLTAGPCSVKACSRQKRTLRDKAWSAIRQRDFFSVDDLLMLLLSEGDSAAAKGNLQSWVTALVSVGYLSGKPETSRTAPRRYRLRREMDTGPLAPAWNKATRMVTDPNTGKRFHVPAKGAA